jgi:serine/threonine protein kinase
MSAITSQLQLPQASLPHPISYTSTIKLSTEAIQIIKIALYILPIRPLINKFYINNNNDRYKISLKNQECQHSIRRISESSFVITLNRKDSNTKLGEGSFKVAKKAILVLKTSASTATVSSAAIVKDKSSQRAPFLTETYESLSNLSYVECVKKITHKTSKGRYKQFHIAKNALCDAHHLVEFTPKPNFSGYINICKDAVLGLSELNEKGFIHGDLKPANILVYYTKGASFLYSAKLTDLNSILLPGTLVTDQTSFYLAPTHRALLIKEALSRSMPINHQTITELYENTPSIKLISSTEAAIASLGITLIHIGLNMELTSICGAADKMTAFWNIVSDLTGGFIPTEPDRMSTYIEKLNRQLFEYITSGIPIPNPSISLAVAAARLSELMTLSAPIEIPFPIDPSPVELEKHYPLQALPLLQFFQSKISSIYDLYLKNIAYEKIYFSETSAYVKQMNQTGEMAPHSIQRIATDLFILNINRKLKVSSTYKTNRNLKYIWEIHVKAPGVLCARWKTLLKDRDAKKTYLPWHIASLSDTHHVEICPRFIHKTSSHYFKGLHLSETALCTGANLNEHASSISFVDFLHISLSIIAGQIELHSKNSVHNNLKINNILIYPPSELGTTAFTSLLSAKIAMSESIVPFGTSSNSSVFGYLSPKQRQLVYNKIATPTYAPTLDQVRARYNSDISLRNIILTKEDATVTTALVIVDMLLRIPSLLEKITPEKALAFWSIIDDLTGGFGPLPKTTSYQSYSLQIHHKMTSSSSPETYTPKITLEKAHSKLSSLF